jgi:hypothetical protein
MFFEKQTGYPMHKLISDGGGEFVNQELAQVLIKAGVQHTVAPPSQHSGIAERANRTIIDMTRTMLMQANFAPQWWAEAVKMATATANCLPLLSKSQKLPVELLFKTAPNMHLFRPFSCRTWMLKPEANRNAKFDAISWDGVLLGYENDYLAYQVYHFDKEIVTM